MKSLKNNTILAAALVSLMPGVLPMPALAAGNGDCVAGKIAEGMSKKEAKAACNGAVQGFVPKAAPEAEAAPQAEAPAQQEAAPSDGFVVKKKQKKAAPEQTTAEPALAPKAQPAPAAEATPETQPVAPAPKTVTAPEATAPAQPTEEATSNSAAEPAPKPGFVTPKKKKTDADALAKQLAEPTGEAAKPAETVSEPTVVAPKPPAVETATETPPALPQGTEAEGKAVLEEAIAAPKEAEKGAPVQNEALLAPASSETTPPANGKGEAPKSGGFIKPQPNETTEVITKDNARSSAQDFSNSVSADPKKKKKNTELSDFEKLAILGLGAVAVGTMLNNGSHVAVNSGDRVVVQNPDGTYSVIKDDNALLRQPGSTMRTQRYDDGSTRTILTKEDGSQVITVYDAQRRIVQRTLIEPDGRRYVLIDDARGAEPVRMSSSANPESGWNDYTGASDEEALRRALAEQGSIDRHYTLAQIREIPGVRALAPAVSVETVTFESGSSAIRPDQARSLATLGDTIRSEIEANPHEVFLVEGHTDAVGDAAYNLALSDRRAESMALALTEYFGVPAENLVVQGYGERFLKVDTQGPSEANRRVAVRRITDLLQLADN